jgi:hypothetical protein
MRGWEKGKAPRKRQVKQTLISRYFPDLGFAVRVGKKRARYVWFCTKPHPPSFGSIPPPPFIDQSQSYHRTKKGHSNPSPLHSPLAAAGLWGLLDIFSSTLPPPLRCGFGSQMGGMRGETRPDLSVFVSKSGASISSSMLSLVYDWSLSLPRRD